MSAPAKWYHGVSRYQWLVVIIASAGWVFDAFEGQLFNITRNQMLADILHVGPGDQAIKYWGEVFLAVFLLGGTCGGILFGWVGRACRGRELADRVFGRACPGAAGVVGACPSKGTGIVARGETKGRGT